MVPRSTPCSSSPPPAAIVMGAANDLIVLFVGLETLSLAFYVLAASYRRKAGSSESGHQVLRARRVLVGVLPLRRGPRLRRHRLDQHLDDGRHACRATVPVERNDTLVLAGVALLLVGLGFKVAAVPFHVWTPDVYQGAPTPVTAFMASVGKVAAFAALLRVFVVALPFYRDDWRPAVWVLAVAVAGRRLGARRRADRRQADARLLVDLPRRLHPRRRRGGRRTGPARSTAGSACRARSSTSDLRRARRRHVRRRRPRRPPRRPRHDARRLPRARRASGRCWRSP